MRLPPFHLAFPSTASTRPAPFTGAARLAGGAELARMDAVLFHRAG